MKNFTLVKNNVGKENKVRPKKISNTLGYSGQYFIKNTRKSMHAEIFCSNAFPLQIVENSVLNENSVFLGLVNVNFLKQELTCRAF